MWYGVAKPQPTTKKNWCIWANNRDFLLPRLPTPVRWGLGWVEETGFQGSA